MESENPPKRTVRLRIEGMSCAGCSSGVESSLAAVAGVESVAVSLTLAVGQIKDIAALGSCAELALGVQAGGVVAVAVEDPTDAGPEAGVATCALTIGGMSCTSCEAAVTAALLAVPGVQEATVSLSLSKARVKFDPDVCGPRPLIEAAEAAGFDAALAPRDARPGGADVQAREKRFWRRKLYLSLIFTVPLFIFDMILMYIPGPKHWLESTVGGFQIGAVISFCLATPVQVGFNVWLVIEGVDYYHLGREAFLLFIEASPPAHQLLPPCVCSVLDRLGVPRPRAAHAAPRPG